MQEALKQAENFFQELTEQLSDPAVLSDPNKLRVVAKKRSDLEPLVAAFSEYRKLEREIADDEEAIDSGDAELAELAEAELPELREKYKELQAKLQRLLVPRDPNDDRNVVLEIRAGTGGTEAALFAGEIYRMYQRYAEGEGWKIEVLSMSDSELGGIKEVVLSVQGEGAYARLKYESGVHRVQRVGAGCAL